MASLHDPALTALEAAEPASVSLDKLDRIAISLRADSTQPSQRPQSQRQALEALGIKLWNACGGLSLDVDASSRVAALRHVAAWLFYVSAPDSPTSAEQTASLSVLSVAAEALLSAPDRCPVRTETARRQALQRCPGAAAQGC